MYLHFLLQCKEHISLYQEACIIMFLRNGNKIIILIYIYITYIVYQLYPVFSQLVQFQTGIGLLGNFSQLVPGICKLLTILLYYSQASITHRSYYVTPPSSLKTNSSVDMVHSSKTLATTTRLYPLELSPVKIE